MNDSAAGSLFGVVMSPLVLLLLYTTIKAAATGPIDRNGLVGLRMQSTKRSDAAWRAGHVAALPVARRVVIAMLVLDAVVLILLFVGPGWFAPWAGVVPGVGLCLAMVPVCLAATKAANAAPDD